MRTILLLIIFVAFSSPIQAETYANIYAGKLDTLESSGSEVAFEDTDIYTVFGIRTDHKVAPGAELFFHKHGLGGAFQLSGSLGNLTLFGGPLAISDHSTGATAFGNATDTETGFGYNLGLSYQRFSARYINYTVDHRYFRLQCDSQGMNCQSSTADSSARRQGVWLGAHFGF